MKSSSYHIRNRPWGLGPLDQELYVRFGIFLTKEGRFIGPGAGNAGLIDYSDPTGPQYAFTDADTADLCAAATNGDVFAQAVLNVAAKNKIKS